MNNATPKRKPPAAGDSASWDVLLKFQIGPVQDFIAQARSTRDLWSGSYLLSWLVAAGTRKCLQLGGKLIFPSAEGGSQPLLNLPDLPMDGDQTGLLTPNIPNIFIVRMTGDATGVAEQIAQEIGDEWRRIADAVWNCRNRFELPADSKRRYDAQVKRHLTIDWQATRVGWKNDSETYREAYRGNGWLLDAVRQTRAFVGWDSADGMMEKDSLSGREEALVGGYGNDENGRTYQDRMAALAQRWKGQVEGAYPALFSKHADCLGAVAVIKRVWHLAYLKEVETNGKPALKTSSTQHRIRSIPAIASRRATHDDDEMGAESGGGDNYIAAIAFDGDSIGAWVNGDKSPDDVDLATHHQNFSRALSVFALRKVREIVEGSKDDQAAGWWKGQLIYAGGDDVLCLVPADAALSIAAELRDAFREVTRDTPAIADRPDASVGIAIGHVRAPLQDIIREARRAEKRAKNEVGRPAFSVTLMKRSGEISHWGSQWETGGLELYWKIDRMLRDRVLSGKFPHRVCQLLEPYLTRRSGLSKQDDAIESENEACEIIAREFQHTAERQGGKGACGQLDAPLKAYLERILTSRSAREERSGHRSQLTATQEMLTSIIGLCTTVAFAGRDRAPENAPRP